MQEIESDLNDYIANLERYAEQLGLDYYPIDFELVPTNFMTEIAVYGLPIRMPHWSFGVRYIHQLIRQSMGHSRIFEVMFPGDPCHAYLVKDNSLAENTLVLAHVIGHADFAKNNHLFSEFMSMGGGHILEQAARHAHVIDSALAQHGQDRVEALLDVALALEPHIDINQRLHREPIPAPSPANKRDSHFPPRPEYDLLWFIARYAPDLEGWERDIFLAVREESFYFYPIGTITADAKEKINAKSFTHFQ